MRASLAALAFLLAGAAVPAPAAEIAPVRVSAIPAARHALPRPPGRPEQVVRVTTRMTNIGFQQWLDGFQARARAQGIRQPTLDAALAGIDYNTDVISRDRNQSEFSKSLWEYLDSAVSDSRIRNGQAALARHARVLDRIEATYGVDKEVVVAVWGMESSYGSHRGRTPIIEALATLAYDGRRGDFFEEQLIAALKIVQAGDVPPRAMTGSWAGAMGHTQFIPTSYLSFAVDFTGDGKRDIWSDDPADALASTAAYLKRHGWQRGYPWGVEVVLPQGFDFGLAGDHDKRPVTQWAAMGVQSADGAPLRDYGDAAILLPAGARGPAFMIFRNFNVIERYNSADSYVIAVGHLSDRLRGAAAFRQGWPRDERALRFSERKELQQRLTQAGFNTNGVDGRIGPNTIAAIRQYQTASGMVPDGYASVDLLRHLR